ncbi:MAG TPA: c-type cytochrome, partial [Thiolinea sp.]|nr:c-type cytochrome [Thiolinea sp.]
MQVVTDTVEQAADATAEAATDAVQTATDTAEKAVAATAAAAAPAAASAETLEAGKKIYNSLCMSCHDIGLANAPKLGDKAAWEPRLAEGMDTVYSRALHGFNAMPAKGGNPAFTDEQVKAAVDYMISSVK